MEEENKEAPVEEEGTEEESPTEETPKEETPEEVEPEEEVPQDSPPIRKSAEYWQSEREKLLAKQARAEYFKAKQNLDSEQEEAEPENPLSSELEPIKKYIREQSDASELSEVFKKFPEAEKHKDTIKKWADVYENVPLEGVAKMVLFDRTFRKQEAEQKAKSTRLGGHSKRPAESKAKTAWEKTDEEFQQELSKARSR